MKLIIDTFITPSGFEAIVDVASLGSMRAIMYPNPTITDLNIDFDSYNRKAVSVLIYDMAGRLVMRKQYNLDGYQQTLKVAVNSYAAGMYILQLLNENNKEIHSGKFVKL